MAEKSSVLVTGAAGFIGSHLTERLLQDGYSVFALDNFCDFYDPYIKRTNIENCLHNPDFTLIEADIRDRERLDAVFELYPIDMVIHLAAMAGVRPSIENPGLYNDVNINGTLNLLEASAKKGIKHFVFASSSSVYGNNKNLPYKETDPVDTPISPYAATKKAGELFCHNWHHHFGMSIVCLRLFTVYGPRQRPDLAIHKFSKLLTADEEIPVFGDGSTSRDYTYVADVIDGILGAMNYVRSGNRYEVINLGESETISLAAMINYLEQLSGKKAHRRAMPMQSGDLQHTFADISKARELLNYSPRTSFRDGIALWWDWFSRQ
ncbi:MAG TPA: SDR family NAD(P)-dependent oxidoreductase [Candidatus Cloacimonadota bacterium]|nr:SDR family NAD(P)-dependent oxidoreductase [Candidatus Cloacimonadota bacterium]HPS37937.1 SDR family NAD(P)-dependent oxidoreductase [Candidatus Cloacimonadota bacterium]